MDITFACESCRQSIEIDEAGAGLSVQCPSCGSNLTVPGLGSSLQSSPSSVSQSAKAQGMTVECEIRSEGIAGKVIEINRLDFHGWCSISPNSRFTLAWCDACTGERTWGEYLLMEGNRILVRGKMQRPHDGKAANNGNFILNDWMWGEGLKGTFYAFASSGEILLRVRLRANLDTSEISDDGRLAFCGTCTSDYEPHSDKVFVFDLETRKKLSTLKGRAGRWNEIEPEEGILHFVSDNGVDHRYNFEGKFLGAAPWAKISQLINRIEQNGRASNCSLDHSTLIALYATCGNEAKAAEHRSALIKLNEERLQGADEGWHRRGIHWELIDLYTASGNEVKAAEHQNVWLNTGNGYEVFKFAEGKIEKLTGTDLTTYSEAISLLGRAIELGVDERHQARIYRILGEVYLQCGDNQNALEYLEAALRLNPKIGVKELVSRLKSNTANGESLTT